MLKKLRTILIFMLIVPLMFSISACKKKDNNSGSNGTQNEQGGGIPSNPDNPSTPDNPSSVDDTYTVSFDYDMPERLEGLLEDYEVSASTSDTTVLPTISNTRLASYFLGWYDEENELIETGVKADKGETIYLKAKWNSGLNKYYYSEGLTFEINTTTGYATITSYTGTDEVVYLPIYYSNKSIDYLVRIIGESAFENSTAKEVKTSFEALTINSKAFKNSKLEKFDFSGVYIIGDEAFYGTKLTSAVMGKFLQECGYGAFQNCSELEEADFSKIELSTFTSISSYLFANCAKLSSVKINNYITTINSYTFLNCSALANVDFLAEHNISNLSSYVFANCTAIEELTLPKKIDNIGYDVFSGCSNVKKLNLGAIHYVNSSDRMSTYLGDLTASLQEITLVGNTITDIPSYYFSGYSNLTKFTMCNSVESLGSYAFMGCTSLSEITLSANLDIDNFSVSSITDTAWYNNMTECLVIDNVLLVAPTTISGEVTIQNGITTISASAFKNNTAITKANIPSTVSFIGESAFYYCTALEVVNFEENNVLESISDSTFYGCSALKLINFENCTNLTILGKWAFRDALNVSEFALPASLAELGEDAFRNARVSAYTIAEANTKFETINGVLYEEKDGKPVTLLAYPKRNTNNTFVVPETVTCIKNYAFSNTGYLVAVYIASTNAGAENYAFDGAGRYGVLSVYTEDLSLSFASSLIYVYKLMSDENYTVSDDGNYTISIVDGVEVTEGNYYAKIDNDGDYVFVSFNVNVSGETIETTSQSVVNLEFVL